MYKAEDEIHVLLRQHAVAARCIDKKSLFN